MSPFNEQVAAMDDTMAADPMPLALRTQLVNFANLHDIGGPVPCAHYDPAADAVVVHGVAVDRDGIAHDTTDQVRSMTQLRDLLGY